MEFFFFILMIMNGRKDVGIFYTEKGSKDGNFFKFFVQYMIQKIQKQFRKARKHFRNPKTIQGS
jgi:hypothetical protein